MTDHDTHKNKNNKNPTIQDSIRKSNTHLHLLPRLHQNQNQNQKANRVSDKKEMKVFHINQIIKWKKQRL
jgi:hypothetical protein